VKKPTFRRPSLSSSSGYLFFNHLTQLIVQENFIILSHWESNESHNLLRLITVCVHKPSGSVSWDKHLFHAFQVAETQNKDLAFPIAF
jgi:hypothetical protein